MILWIISGPLLCYLLLMFTVAIFSSFGYKPDEVQNLSMFVAYVQVYFVVIILASIKRRIYGRGK